MTDGPGFTPAGVYGETDFHYLLESESKRSVRSGYSYRLVLVSQVTSQGELGVLDPRVARTVMIAMSSCVRETDYVGWYRQGHIVGGVLTVIGKDVPVEAIGGLNGRLLETFRAELGLETSSTIRICICSHEEIEQSWREEKVFPAN